MLTDGKLVFPFLCSSAGPLLILTSRRGFGEVIRPAGELEELPGPLVRSR